MNQSGYTLVEMLVVVTILGIAASVVVPQLLEPGSLEVQAASRMVISDILIAQNEAVGHAAARRIHFDIDNNAYFFTDGDDMPIAMTGRVDPYGVSFESDPRFSNVHIEAVDFGGNTWVGFDDIGGPVMGGTLDVVAPKHRYRVTVRDFTGRVTVEPVSP